MANPIISYLRQSRQELQKVIWPSRQTTINHTLMVVAFSLGMAAVLGAMDYVFVQLINLLLARQ